MASLSYSNWSCTHDGHSSHCDARSSGTAQIVSGLIPTRRCGVISGSVRGGFAWAAGYTEDGIDPENLLETDSLRVDLTIGIWLCNSSGTRVSQVASATGSATRGGKYRLYDTATSASASYNPASLSESQKNSYPYLQVVFTCSTTDSSISVECEDGQYNYDQGNPSGSASWTVRETTNILHRNSAAASFTNIVDLYADGQYMYGLTYNGGRIF